MQSVHEFPSNRDVVVNKGGTGVKKSKFVLIQMLLFTCLSESRRFLCGQKYLSNLDNNKSTWKIHDFDSSVPGKAILEQTVRSIFQFFGNGHRHGDEVS